MATEMSPGALPELETLAKWMRSGAEMTKVEKKNMLHCADEAGKEKARPLLERLRYASIPVKDHQSCLEMVSDLSSILPY